MYIYFDLEKDFFEVNGGAKLFFNEAIKEKKYDKATLSKKMWCVALYNHEKKENPLYDQTNDERLRIIKANRYDEVVESESKKNKKRDSLIWNRDSEEDKALAEIWKQMTMTKYEKLLKLWYDKEEERTKFVSNTPYTIDNWEMIDKIRASTYKIWQDFEKINKMISEEVEEKTMGGQEESFLESLRQI